MDAKTKLDEIAKAIDDGEESPRVTVRAFLSWFGAQRRGIYVVQRIRDALTSARLITEPDFESAYIDSEIELRTKAKDPPPNDPSNDDSPTEEDNSTPKLIGGAEVDPTNRIGKLEAANRQPESIKPGTPLSEAMTLMLVKDFSQLPIMQNERTLKGVISWKSVGNQLALGLKPETVDECMEPPRVTSADTSLFDAIDGIVRFQYVLVRDSQAKISGIVTTSDLGLEFRKLAEPFLLLGEIEKYVRSLLRDKFNEEQLISVRDPSDARPIARVEDLSFGEYLRLMEKPEHWELLGLTLGRKAFISNFDNVRRIRNDVMHFDPDGLSPEDLDTLRQSARFIHQVVSTLDRNDRNK